MQLFKFVIRLALLASVPTIVVTAPSAWAEVPFRPMLLAAQPISQAELAGWMPQSIAENFVGTKIYIQETSFSGRRSIGFALTRGCSATYCSAGSITTMDNFESEGQPVPLHRGITGYISRGAGMNGIAWQQADLSYEINFKLSPEDLVTFANYMIDKTEDL